MVSKKFILVFLVSLSFFIFSCDAQDNALVDNNNIMLNSEDVEDDIVETSNSVNEDVFDDDFDESVIDDNYLFDLDHDDSSEGMTRAEVAQRNSENDCWVGFNNLVYDLTSWLSRHPGGANAIIPYCGTVEEFTEAYNEQHNKAGTKMELSRNDAIGNLI